MKIILYLLWGIVIGVVFAGGFVTGYKWENKKKSKDDFMKDWKYNKDSSIAFMPSGDTVIPVEISEMYVVVQSENFQAKRRKGKWEIKGDCNCEKILEMWFKSDSSNRKRISEALK